MRRSSAWQLAGTERLAIIAVLALLSTTDRFGEWAVARARAQAPAAASEADDGMAVVPPGQEDLLAAMFGSGAALPPQCRFTGGDADGAILHATYTCGQDEIVLALHYPDAVSRPTARTNQFAIVVQSGTPPPGLLDALTKSIRARENEFHWTMLQLPPKPGAAWKRLLGIGGAVAALAVAIVLLRRRRSA
jgi:hypothetical protein